MKKHWQMWLDIRPGTHLARDKAFEDKGECFTVPEMPRNHLHATYSEGI